MVEVSVFHIGTTNLDPLELDDGTKITDGSIRDVHEDLKQVTKHQVEWGVLAEEYGFDRYVMPEHHFEAPGPEYSPNPMMSQMAVAAQTEDIKLTQGGNIITWHEPVRFAEQAAMLDLISDGRAEIGVGRGYQPRENEVLGQFWSGSVQDQEENRQSFMEKWEIVEQAWTQDLFSYEGNYHYYPPKHTKWHHSMEKKWLEHDVTDHDVDDMLNWRDDEKYSMVAMNSVLGGGTTLKSFPVYPQPQQQPHPQIWLPMTSPRTIEYGAKNGFNGFFTLEPPRVMKQNIDMFMEFSEEAGWPDRRPEYDGEPFKRGWDEERQRGCMVGRFVFNTDVPGQDEETLDRWKRGLEHGWSYFGPFGFAAVLSDVDEDPIDPDTTVTAEMLIERDIAMIGDTDELKDKIASFKETLQFDDFNFEAWFEVAGFKPDEANAQLKHFGENIIPWMREEWPSPGEPGY